MDVTDRTIDVEVMDIEAARSRWERLESRGTATPFQSFQWVSALMATVGRARRSAAFVVIARDANTNEDLMLLPLARRRVGAIRLTEVPDFGVSDYCAPILAPSIATASAAFAPVWDRVLATVPRGAALRLAKVPAQIGRVANPLLDVRAFRQAELSSWSVALPEKWADYEAVVLSRGTRSMLHRGLRKLEASGPVELAVASDIATMETFFATLCEQREARFSKLGRPDVLREPGFRDFYIRILQSGLGSIAALRRGQDVVATLLGLHWRDAYLVLLPGMANDKDLQKIRVGKLLFWLQMREMHRRGCRHYDFTIGDEPYKREFGAVGAGTFDTTIAMAVAGYPMVWSGNIKAGLKRLLRGANRAATPTG